MTLQHVEILFQLIAFVFAISVHESAHAWMANLRGDPTARMLGRVTLNPIKHIDPVGTVLLPLIAAFAHFPVIGWAKPTPVNPRNFKRPMLDDILTSVVGPVSNFVIAIIAVTLLMVIKHTSPMGDQIVSGIPQGFVPLQSDSFLVPVSLLLYEFMTINIVLGVFNLIPVPPLDGRQPCAPTFLAFKFAAHLRPRWHVCIDGAGVSWRRTSRQIDLSGDWYL